MAYVVMAATDTIMKHFTVAKVLSCLLARACERVCWHALACASVLLGLRSLVCRLMSMCDGQGGWGGGGWGKQWKVKSCSGRRSQAVQTSKHVASVGTAGSAPNALALEKKFSTR